MTLVMERAANEPATQSAPASRRQLLFLLPWAVPAAALIYGLHRTGTPSRDIALYVGYFLVAILLPGTLVHRAFRGSRGNLPEDLGLGAATGFFVLIVGWALCAATRLQELLPGWPLLIIALFLAIPGLRRHWRIPRDARRPLPAAWSWIVAGATLVTVISCYSYWAEYALPPTTQAWYPDLLYHLGLIGEMTRSIPFQVPQLAGDTLHYHYLSDADMAAASMITRIPAPVILLRLWIVPVVLTAIVACAAVTRELTGKWWAGALGGTAAMFANPLVLGSATTAFGVAPFTFLSPSQTYAVPALALLVSVSVDVLRGRNLRWAWLLVLPIGVFCAGAKSSTLPPFVAGLLLAILVVLLVHRDRWLGAVLLLVLSIGAMLIGAKLFAGGGASTLAVQPFAILYWFPPYTLTLGAHDTVDHSTTFPLGIQQAGSSGILFGLTALGWWALLQAARLVGLFSLTIRRTRTDPAAWLLGGMAVAGAGALWLLWHPAASQLYFWLCAAPFGVLLSVWLLAERALSWRPVVAGLLAGGVWAIGAPHVRAPREQTVAAWRWVLFAPLLRTVVVAAGVAVVGLIIWRFVRGRFAWRAVSAGLVAAILGGAIAGAVQSNSVIAWNELHGRFGPGYRSKLITAAEQRAAIWLGEHSGRDDLFATNVHCNPLSWRAACDARAFWPVGLSGRRALVESWGYTDQAVANDGVGGKRFLEQPSPYPDRYALNQRVFRVADAADVNELRTKYHVRWLLADTEAAGGVSPRLAQVCKLRYQSGTASVYQL